MLDTNTAISGLLWHGTPSRLIDAAQANSISLYTSAPLLGELRGVLARGKFAKQLAARGLQFEEVFEGFAALAAVVVPAIITPAIARDPADDRSRVVGPRTGATGSGRGLTPRWLAEKEKADAKREEFLIKPAPAQGAKGKACG